MERLVVHDLEEDVKEGLQRRAAAHGHSMEEEARHILRAAILTDDSDETEGGLGTETAEMFKGLGLEKGVIRELRGPEFSIKPVIFKDENDQ